MGCVKFVFALLPDGTHQVCVCTVERWDMSSFCLHCCMMGCVKLVFALLHDEKCQMFALQHDGIILICVCTDAWWDVSSLHCYGWDMFSVCAFA